MTTTEILSQLREKGVRLRVNGDRLRVDAPVQVVTSELRDLLAERKADLIDLIRPPRGRLAQELPPDVLTTIRRYARAAEESLALIPPLEGEPVEEVHPSAQRSRRQRERDRSPRVNGRLPGKPITKKQLAYLRHLDSRSELAIRATARNNFGVRLEELTAREAGAILDDMKLFREILEEPRYAEWTAEYMR